MSSTELPAWVKPGATFKAQDRRFHVRGIVDGCAVLREWLPSKQRWNYTVEGPIYFWVWGNDLKIGRRPK